MDHLPLPRNSIKHPSVPVLAFKGTPCRYIKYPFSEFPTLNGYNKSQLLVTGDYTNNGIKAKDDAEAFVQQWLWFGLLSEFFERDLDMEQFICRQHGSHVATLATHCLPNMLTEWCRETDNMRFARERRFERIQKLLKEASLFVDLGLSHSKSKSIVRSEIVLSIQMLGCTLAKAFSLIQKWSNMYHVTPTWGSSSWAVERLLEHGWCPSTVSLLTHWFPGGHYYLSLMEPLRIQMDHEHCTRVKCIHEELQSTDPIPTINHVEKDCQCQLLTLPPHALAEIVDAKKIPLVAITDSPEISIKLTPVEFQSGSTYIAISHVWADGMGNPRLDDGSPVNGLTKCQIARLYEFCKNLLPNNPVLIWMDTLCIPAQEEYKRQRREAISTMRQVYSKATKVLVLDAELLLACRHSSNLELLLRLYSSRWMRRVWTLQEGVLNKNTYIQFRDGAISPPQICSWIQQGRDYAPRGERQFMVDEVVHRWEKMTDIINLPKPDNLVSIYEFFQYRRTSHKRDESICLSILSGLEIKAIKTIISTPNNTETDAADRGMQQFLRLHVQIPIFLLFAGNKHFEEDGFRWAPRSFIRHDIGDSSGPGNFRTTGTTDDTQFLTIEKDNVRRSGLYFSCTGFLIKIPLGDTCPRIINLHVPYSWWENRQYICIFKNSQTSAAQEGLNGLGRPAIVFKETGHGALGALVDITEDIEGRFFAKYICQTMLWQKHEEDVEISRARLIAQENDEAIDNMSGEHVVFEGAKLEYTQKWCIY